MKLQLLQIVLFAAVAANAADSCLNGYCYTNQGSYSGITNTVQVPAYICEVLGVWWGGNTVSCVLGTDRLAGFQPGEEVLLSWSKKSDAVYSVNSIWSDNAGWVEIVDDASDRIVAKFTISNAATSSLKIGFTISRENEVSVTSSSFFGFLMKSNQAAATVEALDAAQTQESLFSTACAVTATFDRGNTVECSIYTVRTTSYPSHTALVLSFSKPGDVLVNGLPWSLQTDPIHFRYVQSATDVTFVVRTDWTASRYLKFAFQVVRRNDYTLKGSYFSNFNFKSDLAAFTSPGFNAETSFSNIKSFDDLEIDTENTPTYFKIIPKLAQTMMNSEIVDIVKVTFKSLFLGSDFPAGFVEFYLVNYNTDVDVKYLDTRLNQWVSLSSTVAQNFTTEGTGEQVISFYTPGLLDMAAVVMNWQYRTAKDPVFLILKSEIMYEMQRVDQDLPSNNVNQRLRAKLIPKVGVAGLSGVKDMFTQMNKDFLDGDPCGNTEVYVSLQKNLYVASPLTSSACSASVSGNFRGLSIWDSIVGAAGAAVQTVSNGFNDAKNAVVTGANNLVNTAVNGLVTVGQSFVTTVVNLAGEVVQLAGQAKDVLSVAGNEFTQFVLNGYDKAKNLAISIGNGIVLIVKNVVDAFVAFGKMVENAVEILVELIEKFFNQDDVRRSYRVMRHMLQLTGTTFGAFYERKSDSVSVDLPIGNLDTDSLSKIQELIPKVPDMPTLDLGIVGRALSSIMDDLDQAIGADTDFDLGLDDLEDLLDNETAGVAEDASFFPETSGFPGFSFSTSSIPSALVVSKLRTELVSAVYSKSWDFLNIFELPDSFPFNYVNMLCETLMGVKCSLVNILVFAAAELFTLTWKAANSLAAPFTASLESQILSKETFSDLYDLMYGNSSESDSFGSLGLLEYNCNLGSRSTRKVFYSFASAISFLFSIPRLLKVYFAYKTIKLGRAQVQPGYTGKFINGLTCFYDPMLSSRNSNKLQKLLDVVFVATEIVLGGSLFLGTAFSFFEQEVFLLQSVTLSGVSYALSSYAKFTGKSISQKLLKKIRFLFFSSQLASAIFEAFLGVFKAYCASVYTDAIPKAMSTVSSINSFSASFARVLDAVCVTEGNRLKIQKISKSEYAVLALNLIRGAASVTASGLFAANAAVAGK